MKTGIVAIAGRPSVGKSTLLNRLVGERLAITSPKAQTTRHRILGVANRPDAQLVLIDTPGLIKPYHRMNERMMAASRAAIAESDVVLWLVDASERDGPHNRPVADLMRQSGKPIVLAINKIDKVGRASLLPLIAGYKNRVDFQGIVPISARTGDGVEELSALLAKLLPEGTPLYGGDDLTDRPARFFVAEFVREAILQNSGQEVPHSTAVLVRLFEEPATKENGEKEGRVIRIAADIMVEREGQKAILIGRGGSTLKKIGTDARASIERFLDSPVYLELFVKVRKSWREDDRALDEVLG